MRTVIQKVSNASVEIGNKIHNEIKNGLLILIGIEDADDNGDIDWLCGKISKMRIFNDEKGIMNLSVKDIKGEIMVISQFTLHASTKKGNRPSYIKAAKPEKAITLYDMFINQLSKETNIKVKSGIFGANMKIFLVNNGPVTIIMDTKNKE